MKHAILAVLTQGPAYGLQIRNELQRRLERKRPINVGQVYATIDRLVRDGLAVQNSRTDDGLPLYALSADGEREVARWLQQPADDASKPWESMVAQVLIARSLPGINAEPLIDALLLQWRSKRDAPTGSALSDVADRELARAAVAWLVAVRESTPLQTPVSQVRPPKGRPKL